MLNSKWTYELYADFTGSGKAYTHFPDTRNHRLYLRDLLKEEVRDLLRRVWDDPLSLDPSRRSAKVTRELAAQLAVLAQSLEQSGYAAQRVASFLMRCIFTMFAEDVGLLPKESFTALLLKLRERLETFPEMLRSLWETMDRGGFSPVLMERLLHFNGGLFEDPEALKVTRDQINFLIHASRADWREVEPAIFGTLLERALDPEERHKIGAHYTPRAYVERLVLPTVIEPLRAEWSSVRSQRWRWATRARSTRRSTR